MARLGGVEALLRAFPYVKDRGARLIITGAGWTKGLEALAKRDARVIYKGLVSSGELDAICATAEVFVNPRPTRMVENGANFPSKILEYLAWERPVISTYTLGMHPAYRKVCVIFDDATPENLAAKIDEVLLWDDETYYGVCENIRRWNGSDKSWYAQCGRLITWLSAERQLS